MTERLNAEIEEEVKEPKIMYETAERFFEDQRPSILKEIDARNPEQRKQTREIIFALVSKRLLAEGETQPISRAHADTGDGLRPMVKKTVLEWARYINEAVIEMNKDLL